VFGDKTPVFTAIELLRHFIDDGNKHLLVSALKGRNLIGHAPEDCTDFVIL